MFSSFCNSLFSNCFPLYPWIIDCVCVYVCVCVCTVGYRLITGERRKVLCVSPGSELSRVLVTLSICSLAPNQGQMEPQRLTWLHPQLQLFITAIFFSPFFPLSALNRALHCSPSELKYVFFHWAFLVNMLFFLNKSIHSQSAEKFSALLYDNHPRNMVINWY